MKYKSFHYYVNEHFKDKKVILELGSGVGDMLISPQFELYAIEQDSAFLGKLTGITYLYVPIVNGWYDAKILQRMLAKIQYDLVIVDGPRGSKNRLNIQHAFSLFNMDVPWIFDDTNRLTEKYIASVFSQFVSRPMTEFDCGNKNFTVI